MDCRLFIPFNLLLQLTNPLAMSLPYPLTIFLLLITFTLTQAQEKPEQIPTLENPMSTAYLKKNMIKGHPRLILTRKTETVLKQKIKNDPVLQNVYKAFQLNATDILKEPLLERKQVGRRLLGVSREMLYRMNVLAMVYVVEKDPKILTRIDEEIQAVCQFSDWNPSHFLDVAEMSLAVALGLDWCYKDLPKSTREMALNALIEKGIQPSYEKKMSWVNGTNNWNQVCHGGMIAAALMIAEREPELASQTIARALDGMPHALVVYGPDGAYPEGSTYWGYGTSFSVLTASILESSLGTDFGLADYPAFKESAVFRVLCNAPTGMYYNFADCGDRRSENGDFTLAWFATKTGNSAYFEKEQFLRKPEDMGKLTRTAGAGLFWLSQYIPTSTEEFPTAYKADGDNPIVIFTGKENDPNQFYLGAKGGRGTVNHGNMDGGSFIFELNGVRWVVDPGNQNYHTLEKTGFNLWGRCQDCERWTLLTKNNYGHSTLTVNGELHVVDGMAEFTDFKSGENPSATLDLSPTFKGQLQSAQRRFTKESATSLLIEDEVKKSEATQMVTWQLMTQAKVLITPYGALLSQDGKTLRLENLSHPDIQVSVISLDPPPLELDRKLEGLKRLELRIPAYLIPEKGTTLQVRLQGSNTGKFTTPFSSPLHECPKEPLSRRVPN